MSAIIDLSPSSNGSTADWKHTTEDEGDDAALSASAEDTMFAARLFASTHVLESQTKETSGISKDDDNIVPGDDNDVNDDDVNDESACDSKNIKRVDNDAAKDDKQGEGGDNPVEKEDTKSKINSQRD